MLIPLVVAILSLMQSAPPAASRAPGIGVRNALSGRVIAPDGTPVAGAIITLLQRETRHNQPSVHLADARLHVATDADGRYAIEEIPLGEFFVVAIPHNAFRKADGSPNRSGYGVTYYPSAGSAESAMTVTVNVREPVTANITLRPAPLATISGVVTNSKGLPAASERMVVAHGDHLFGIDGAAMRLEGDGTFRLPPLPPGTYFLEYRENGWPPPRGVPQLFSGARVVLDGHDVSGVRVAPVHMVHVTGKVIVDPALRAGFTPGNFHVAVAPINSDGNPGPQRVSSPLDDALSFELEAWPANVWMRLMPEQGGWRITRVTYRGSDVTDSGIELKEGEPVTGIEMYVARR